MSKVQPPATAFQKPAQRHPRIQQYGHLIFIKSLPCLSCGLPDYSDAHHIKPACPKAAKPAAGTQRPDDCFTVPLCRPCHNLLHATGEALFWSRTFKTLKSIAVTRAVIIAAFLWTVTGDYERGEEIINFNLGENR
jgi:hypothetical protein